MANGVATRDCWKNEPMPEKRIRIPLQKYFSTEEYQRIRRGFIPQQMEDKWFIFLEGDWMYFHRGWTGCCIYQVKVESDGSGYKTVEAWCNRDPEQYSCSDENHDSKLLSWIIDGILLGNEDAEMPIPISYRKKL